MKRAELVRHLTSNGCELFREGGRHSIYWNPANRNTAAVLATPRSSRQWRTESARISAFRGPVGRSTAPANKGMKLTKPAQAMELRSLSPRVFGRLSVGARRVT
jgi:hypothetical protein